MKTTMYHFKVLGAALLLLFCGVSWAQIHVPTNPRTKTHTHTNPYCSNIRVKDNTQGITESGDITIAVPRIVQNCIGSIEARITGFGNDLSHTRMQLQQNIAGDWVVIDSGKNIVYKADPGIYRLVVVRTDADSNNTRWNIEYSIPRL